MQRLLHTADLLQLQLLRQACSLICLDSHILFLTLSYPACRQLLHGPQGPLQGLLNTIMDAAERSPQLIAAAAVHLCGLWVRYPAQALRYLDIWEKLLLYGGTSAAPQHPVRLTLRP